MIAYIKKSTNPHSTTPWIVVFTNGKGRKQIESAYHSYRHAKSTLKILQSYGNYYWQADTQWEEGSVNWRYYFWP